MMWGWWLAAALATGFRGDGTATWSNGSLPTDPATAVVWTTPLGAVGNGSPIVIGDVVVVGVEPNVLTAVSLSSGRVLWQRAHHVVDALDADLRATISASLAGLPKLEADLRTARSSLSIARRDARAGVAGADARVTGFSADVSRLVERIAALEPYRTYNDDEVLGFASPTPATDGRRIIALFGQGVVAAWTPTGEKLWSRWLGEGTKPMYGYDRGTSSSPIVQDGYVIVAHGGLHALDAATGSVRWSRPGWPHYGTPAVTKVGSRTVIVTPDGAFLNITDGRQLGKVETKLWYNGPTALGATVYFVGNRGGAAPGSARVAEAYDVSDSSGTLSIRSRWRVDLSSSIPQNVFATPVADSQKLVVVGELGEVIVLEASSGRILSQATVQGAHEPVFSSPVRVADQLLITTGGGEWFAAPWARPTELRRLAHFKQEQRATAWILPDGLIARLGSSLVRYRGAY